MSSDSITYNSNTTVFDTAAAPLLDLACTRAFAYTAYLSSSTDPDAPHPTMANLWRLVFSVGVYDINFHMSFVSVPDRPPVGRLMVVRSAPQIDLSGDRSYMNWVNLNLTEPNCTLRQVVALVRAKGLDRFMFTLDGRGHRGWLRETVRELQAGGLLALGSLDQVDTDMQWHWFKGMAYKRTDILAGDFYNCYGCATRQPDKCDSEMHATLAALSGRSRPDLVV